MANVAHSTLVTTNMHVPGYQQASDPGAVGAGILWVDTTNGTGRWIAKVRNATNTGWEALSIDKAVPPILGATTPNIVTTLSPLKVTSSSGTADAYAEVGSGRTGSGNSFLDLIGDTTNTDYGLRVIRGGGANGNSAIQHRGTGGLFIIADEAGPIVFQTAAVTRMTIASDGGFTFGAGAASVVETGWTTFTNLAVDRTCDANATTTAELADILGTLIEALKAKGIISA